MSSRPSICVIGCLNTDFVYKLPHSIGYRETLIPLSVSVNPGGRGVVQALACAKQSRTKATINDPSVDVRMMGVVGDDKRGTDMISILQEYGIDTSGIKVLKGKETGYNLNLLEDDRYGYDNSIIPIPGANKCLQASDFTNLSLPLPSLVVLQLEIPLDVVLQILKTAEEAKVPVLLKPCQAQEIPNDFYQRITHLVMNYREASDLSKISYGLCIITSQAPVIAKHFLDLGVQNVVFTLGYKGVYYANKEEEAFVPTEEVFHIGGPLPGDTFLGAYATSIAKGADLPTAAQHANKVSSIFVARKPEIASIPWADEVEDS